jgi:CRP/FNR family transcriptional regulator, cyclic AMP receptor protein
MWEEHNKCLRDHPRQAHVHMAERTSRLVKHRGTDAVGVVTRTLTDEARCVLGECLLFREFEPEEREILFAHVRVRSYAAGETIFLMGSAGDSLMAVLSGNVRISVRSPDGKEIVLAMIPPGEVFGEITLLDGKERSADARATGACSLAILEHRDVLSFLKDRPVVWSKIADVLCGRLRNTYRHIAEIVLLDLPTRLAKALLRFASADECLTSHGQLRVQLSQSELGNICGTSRESINKCVAGWQRRGIVKIDDGVTLVMNRTALEELANPAPLRCSRMAERNGASGPATCARTPRPQPAETRVAATVSGEFMCASEAV